MSTKSGHPGATGSPASRCQQTKPGRQSKLVLQSPLHSSSLIDKVGNGDSLGGAEGNKEGLELGLELGLFVGRALGLELAVFVGE